MRFKALKLWNSETLEPLCSRVRGSAGILPARGRLKELASDVLVTAGGLEADALQLSFGKGMSTGLSPIMRYGEFHA